MEKNLDWEDDDLEDDEFDDMELLERLESLREDMEDLGVMTLSEVIQRIEQLHHKLDSQHPETSQYPEAGSKE